jgi:hypothetical protein
MLRAIPYQHLVAEASQMEWRHVEATKTAL